MKSKSHVSTLATRSAGKCSFLGFALGRQNAHNVDNYHHLERALTKM